MRKSVERIFNIWQERSVYPEELISELKANLQKKDAAPPPGENISLFKVTKHKLISIFIYSNVMLFLRLPVTPKATLKSRIVAEFSVSILSYSM